MKRIRLGEVININGSIAKREKGRDRRVHEVRRKQVQQQSPGIPLLLGRPWPDDALPKCERAREKTHVLELVPTFVCKSEVVGRGHMPANKGNVHR